MTSDRIVVNSTGTHFYLDDKEVTEKAYRKRYPPPPDEHFELNGQTGDSKGWPIASDAISVHPNQRKEHERMCQDKKVPTETTPDGRVIFRDRQHRKNYMREFGYIDRNSYTGY
jgi:hypothetical protein